MAGRFSRKKRTGGTSWLLGLVLMLLLVGAIVLGASWVLRAAKSVGAQDAQKEPETAQQAAPEAPDAQQSVPAAPEIAQADSAPEQTQALPAEQEPEPARVRLMALGDNLIHNTVYWSAELPGGGYDFTPFYAAIAPVVQSYDLACINQETILVSDPALYANYPSFGSPVQVADALAQTGFSVITGATNHCFDKGETGILDTCSFWREHHPDVTVLGIHDSEEDANTLRVVEKNNIKIAMLNYTYGLNYSAPEQKWMVDQFSTFDAVAADLDAAKGAADFVIVFAHWGEEGQTEPNQMQTTWAQFLADHGADLIIGGHPHLVQPLTAVTAEDGRSVPVFWSLGNFLSHQDQARNMLGGMADVTIEKDADGTRITHCELKPTVNVILRQGEWYFYRPMLLDDYTDDLAAQHRFESCTVDAMWSLFDSITKGKTSLDFT